MVDGGAANKGDMRSSSSSSSEIPVGSKMGASTANEAVAAKKKDVTTSPGVVVRNAGHVVRVLHVRSSFSVMGMRVVIRESIWITLNR